MKLLAFIMSFYMLYLSILPCGDRQECNYSIESSISSATDHQEHNHNAEACTPFCACACCATAISYSPFTKLQVTRPTTPTQKYPLYDITFNTEVYFAIWQPPQLS